MGALRLTFAMVSAAAVLGVAATTPIPVALAATTALIMGGTGNPTPNQQYVDAAINTYVAPSLGGTYTGVSTFTPEEGLGALPGETMSITESTAAGVPYLEAKLAEYPGQPIVVFGYSQSGAIGAIEKNTLAAFADAHPDASVPDVTFVLLSCGCRPNGALEFRLGDAYDTSVVDSRARTDTPFKTVDVAWQYDIGSDWPVYPVNLLAVANVVLGGLYVHANYLPSRTVIDGFDNGGQAPSLIGVQGVTAPGVDTTYYLMPTEDLPLFGPLRSVGVPEQLIDIIEPVTRVMVEWGYDRTTPPWQPTPFQLVPKIDPVKAAADVVQAVGEGLNNAVKAVVPAAPAPLAPPAKPAAAARDVAYEKATDDPPKKKAPTSTGEDAPDGEKAINATEPVKADATRANDTPQDSDPRPADTEPADSDSDAG